MAEFCTGGSDNMFSQPYTTVQKLSDRDAYAILKLPLGSSKDDILKKFKEMRIKFSSSKLPHDQKNLSQVEAAYNQLIPPSVNTKSANQSSIREAKAGDPSGLNEFTENVECNSELTDQGNWSVICRSGDSMKHNRTTVTKPNSVDGEQDRKKGEKKKLQKKKQKEKKKLEQQDNQELTSKASNSASESDAAEEELDTNSAFVAKAIGRKIPSALFNSKVEEKKKTIIMNGSNNGPMWTQNLAADEELQKSARAKASEGNKEAAEGRYNGAIKLYSEAIIMDSSDYRFFGNRSYCWDELGQFERALRDAEQAIQLSPTWPKGYFRKGRALKGLEKFLDAETAFERVLALDQSCDEARVELMNLRILRVVRMGFNQQQATSAVTKYVNVQRALDALLEGEFSPRMQVMEDVFYSDDEGEELVAPIRLAPMPQSNVRDIKMNPKNPQGYKSLYVGNVATGVTEKKLHQLFNMHAQVTTIRILHEKCCAFVNFATKEGAGKAMEALQGKELLGLNLVVKFPDHPMVDGVKIGYSSKKPGQTGANKAFYAQK